MDFYEMPKTRKLEKTNKQTNRFEYPTPPPPTDEESHSWNGTKTQNLSSQSIILLIIFFFIRFTQAMRIEGDRERETRIIFSCDIQFNVLKRKVCVTLTPLIPSLYHINEIDVEFFVVVWANCASLF